jgi:hypothetical protein
MKFFTLIPLHMKHKITTADLARAYCSTCIWLLSMNNFIMFLLLHICDNDHPGDAFQWRKYYELHMNKAIHQHVNAYEFFFLPSISGQFNYLVSHPLQDWWDDDCPYCLLSVIIQIMHSAIYQWLVYSWVTRCPVLMGVSHFWGRCPVFRQGKNRMPNSPNLQQCFFFITVTDFSLWHATSSWSLDAYNGKHLPTLINRCMYCCQLFFDLWT